MYESFIKRFLDIIISFAGILILSPIFIILAIAIACDSSGPIFFKQRRVGMNNKIFHIYKFRSMRTDAPKNMPTHLLRDSDSFITPIGRFMRKTSLDELPQLFNILKGDMSIVGPRPSLENQTDLNALRNMNGATSVRPGLTGLAQINGRDELDIHTKAEYDGTYVKDINFVSDLKLFLLTIIRVLKSDGIQEGEK